MRRTVATGGADDDEDEVPGAAGSCDAETCIERCLNSKTLDMGSARIYMYDHNRRCCTESEQKTETDWQNRCTIAVVI
jgi:hypothetical protein